MPVAIKQSLVLALMTTLLPGLSLAAPFPFTSPDGHRHAGRHPFHHPWQHRPAPDAMPAAAHDRPPAPALLAEPRPDLPVPASGDDCAHLAAGAPFDLPLLSTLFHPAWDDLDEHQQAVLAPFAPEWNTWPMAERRSWLAFADRMQSLDEQQRRRARRRILEWANMSPEERRIARINHQRSQRHPPPERMREWEQYRSLTWSEREALRRAAAAERESAARQHGLARHPGPPLPGQLPDESTHSLVPAGNLRTLIGQPRHDGAPPEAPPGPPPDRHRPGEGPPPLPGEQPGEPPPLPVSGPGRPR